MIAVLRQDHLGEQRRARQALVDDLHRRWRRDDLAQRVGPDLAHVDEYLEARGLVLEHLAAFLAHLGHAAAGGRKLLLGGLQADLLAWQMRRQRAPSAVTVAAAARCLRCLGFRLGRQLRLLGRRLGHLSLARLTECEEELVDVDALALASVELLQQLGDPPAQRIDVGQRGAQQMPDRLQERVPVASVVELAQLLADCVNAVVANAALHIASLHHGTRPGNPHSAVIGEPL